MISKAPRQSIIIVGGGASGVLVAAQLLASKAPGLRVTLIERRDEIGRGVAYSARQRDHLLNVAAPGMSAFADDPDHFWRWLLARDLVKADNRFVFMPRRLYGQYLADVLAGFDAEADGRLTIVHEDCVGITDTRVGVEVRLGNGATLSGDLCVLAVGHEERPPKARSVAVRVGSEADTLLDPDAPVMVLGSGLSMVDAWLSLAQARHTGVITVVSRHGLLPKSHKQVARIELAAGDVPFGTDVHIFTDWFRSVVREVNGRGGNWRSVVDGLRPFNQQIWQAWPDTVRRRFLRHLRPFWNIHRHRLPPALHGRLEQAIASGQVRLIAGEFLDVERETLGDGVVAHVRRAGQDAVETFHVARVYDCGGVTVDVEKSSNPVVQALIASGAGRPDTLHIGLDVTVQCQVINRDGVASDRLFAVGPLTRGTFFEIEAIPDIRVQSAELAGRLLESMRPALAD